MKEKITVAVTGISGYGRSYVSTLLNAPDEKNIEFVAAIDPYLERSEQLEELKAKGVMLFESLAEFYQQHTVDLMIISTPIHLHAPFSCLAMEKGSYVLCEKPLCATVDEVTQMMTAEEETGKFAAIGYQWSFSESVTSLKKDILNGDFGRPLSMKTLVLWPRNSAYYNRNAWAGKLKSEKGDWILDSPVNNATAHYLHNMLFLLGDSMESSCVPVSVEAELYRANNIENYDTGILRCKTDRDVEVLFISTHAVPMAIGPLKCYEFENATIAFESTDYACFTARMKDGSIRKYGNPNDSREDKVWQSVEAVRNQTSVVCSVKTATPHIICVNGAQKSVESIAGFPQEFIRKKDCGDAELTWVDGLTESLIQCYRMGVLPSEHGGIPWAVAGKRVDVTGIVEF